MFVLLLLNINIAISDRRLTIIRVRMFLFDDLILWLFLSIISFIDLLIFFWGYAHSVASSCLPIIAEELNVRTKIVSSSEHTNRKI